MTFFAQLVFDTPRPHDFLARTETSTEHDHAIVQSDSVLKVVAFELSQTLVPLVGNQMRKPTIAAFVDGSTRRKINSIVDE